MKKVKVSGKVTHPGVGLFYGRGPNNVSTRDGLTYPVQVHTPDNKLIKLTLAESVKLRETLLEAELALITRKE